MRLASRFALACGLTVPVLVGVLGTAAVRLVRTDVYAEQDEQLRAQTAQLLPVAAAELSAALPTGRDPVRGGSPLPASHLSAPAGGGIAFQHDGRWAVTGAHPPVDRLPVRAGGSATILAERHVWYGVVTTVTAPGGRTGRLWVFAPPGQPERQLRQLRLRIGAVALFAVPISGLVGWLVGRVAAVPLRRLRRRLAALELVRRVGGGSGVPEIDEVAAVVDATLDRYDEQVSRTHQALETARSFAASAAHELRTPLAGIGTNLEVLQRYEQIDRAERQEILADLIDAHRHAVGLLGMLRTLAAGELVTAAAFEPVDLAEVLDAAVSAARTRHPALDLVVSTPVALAHTGWPDGLRCVVDNLIDNAATHGCDPGTGRATVRVALRRDDHGVTLTVDDDGPGIPPELRNAVFERFHRSAVSPGSGLGLTLVAQQVTLHGGQVDVGLPPGGHVRVVLPSPGRDPLPPT